MGVGGMLRSRVGPSTASQGAQPGPSDSNLTTTLGLNTPNSVSARSAPFPSLFCSLSPTSSSSTT